MLWPIHRITLKYPLKSGKYLLVEKRAFLFINRLRLHSRKKIHLIYHRYKEYFYNFHRDFCFYLAYIEDMPFVFRLFYTLKFHCNHRWYDL